MIFATYWVGKGGSRSDLNRILEYSISDNGLGDFTPCAFCNAIGIVSYDPDFLGGNFFPKEISKLGILFNGDPLIEELKASVDRVQPSTSSVILISEELVLSPLKFIVESFEFSLLGSFEASHVYT